MCASSATYATSCSTGKPLAFSSKATAEADPRTGTGELRMTHSRVSWMLAPVERSMAVSAPQMVLHCSFSTSCRVAMPCLMARMKNERLSTGGKMWFGRQRKGLGLKAAMYLLNGRADSRVADVGVNLHKEGAACMMLYTSALP